jgi:hypothetical protein
MYEFHNNKLVLKAKDITHIVSANDEEHHTYRGCIGNYTPAEMVVMFNDIVKFLQDQTDQDRTIPSPVKKFADKLTALRRFTEMGDRAQEAIKANGAAQPEVTKITFVT